MCIRDRAKTVKGMPTAIVMKTVKGKGVSFMENQVGWHEKAPNDEEYAQAMADLEKVGDVYKRQILYNIIKLAPRFLRCPDATDQRSLLTL